VQWEAKRREEDVGAAVGEVDGSLRGGGFVEAMVIPDLFRLRSKAARGWTAMKAGSATCRQTSCCAIRDTYVFSIGPRARWSDNDYHDAYYSVTPAVGGSDRASCVRRGRRLLRGRNRHRPDLQARPPLGPLRLGRLRPADRRRRRFADRPRVRFARSILGGLCHPLRVRHRDPF
jgi:hypothetical protein